MIDINTHYDNIALLKTHTQGIILWDVQLAHQAIAKQ